jgi:hypothetical protein
LGWLCSASCQEKRPIIPDKLLSVRV